MAFTLDTKRKQRFDFMRCLYEKTEGSEMGLVYVEEIADQLGLPHIDTEVIALFLADEGLIRVRMRNIISITHIGVDEVETALANPDKPTAHFPPLGAAPDPAVSVLPPSRPTAMPDFIREAPTPPIDLPVPPVPATPPAREDPGDDLELKSICEAIGLDPRVVTGEAPPSAAESPRISDEVHRMLQRAQAAAAAPILAPPSPPAMAPIPVSRTATARVLRHQPRPAPTAGELADLLASLKLRLLKIRLEPDDMGEAQAEIATAVAQLLSPRPKQPVIMASLATLLSVLEGAQNAPLTNDVRKSLARIRDFLEQP